MEDELLRRAQSRVGTTLKGKYRIDRVLGVGGMAAVYAATHRNKKRFAIKVLHPQLALHGDTVTRFLREGYVANTVDHPGAVAVLDEDRTDDGAAFIVMELLDGAPVDGIAAMRAGRLPVECVLAVADQVLAVLEAAHAKQIVHRDLKPANLFLTRDGTVKVLDFGIARLRELVGDPATATRTGALLGTPAFLPPEQAGGHTNDIDGQTDLWAVGATMFTLLTGAFVHLGDNGTQMAIAAATKPARSISTLVELPSALVQLIDTALAFEKRSRWASAKVMRASLREAARTTYGRMPGRDDLTALFDDLPATTTGPTPFSASAVTELAPATPSPSAKTPPPVGTTTGQSVSSSDVPGSSKRSRAPLVIAGGLLCVGVVGAFGVRSWLHDRDTTKPSASEETRPVLSTPIVSATPATPSTSSSPTLDPPIASVTPPPSHSVKHVPVVAKPSASVPAAATVNCEPPYFFDDAGIRRFKPECVK